jgi:hypothetical protein
MGVAFKAILTAVVVLLVAAIFFGVDRGDRGSADSHLWRGGKNDRFRRLLMTEDGGLRPYTKATLVTLFIIFLGIVWLIPR